jgi:hypothetical protein
MKKSLMKEKNNLSEICFGLNRDTDERSLAVFLQMFTSAEMMDTLIPRLSDKDIDQTVNFLTMMMKKHLQENEYHTIFLGEE